MVSFKKEKQKAGANQLHSGSVSSAVVNKSCIYLAAHPPMTQVMKRK